MKIEYAIIVKNKTRLESLVERFNTQQQARFYIEKSGGDFSDYVAEHERFHTCLHEVQRQLSTVLKNKIIERSFLSSYIFTPGQLIIIIGQDGLVANTAKYARGVPMIAINPDETRYDGVLLPYTESTFLSGVKEVIQQQAKMRTYSFAEAKLADGQRLLAFNDLFIGPGSHISARYKLTYHGKTEEQSSSGIIISTKAGATGWFSSIVNMAYGVTGLMDKHREIKRPELREDQLLYAVREPFLSVRTQISLCAGFIDHGKQLTIESLMPAHGIIFSDGVEVDHLKFNSGATATIGMAREKALMIIPKE